MYTSMIIFLYSSDLHWINLGGSQPLSGQTAPQALKRTKIHQPFENNITNSLLVIWTSLWAECLNWLPLIKSNRNISGPSNLHDGADQALQAKFDFHMLMWKVKWETESSIKNPILWKSQGQKDWRASTPCFCHRRQLLHSHEKDSVSIKHT